MTAFLDAPDVAPKPARAPVQLVARSTAAARSTGAEVRPEPEAAEHTQKRGYQWADTIPFILCHLFIFGAIWSGVTWQSVVLCVVLYCVRMFAVTAGYHRYFSHRTFKTSRVFQFILGVLAESTAQKGVLWWAAHHRDHHKYSDGEQDIHSPRQKGFWYSHCGWLFDWTENTKLDRVKDLTKFPELVWLNKLEKLVPIALGLACWYFFGWSGLFIGFFLSTCLSWHGTFVINSLAHVVGTRRYATEDDSRNNFWLALVTFGEGWHNNHHHYQGSVRQGFYWWEIDITYYVLKALSLVGIVWDLRQPPERVYDPAVQIQRA